MWQEENAMLMNSNEYLHIVESIKQEIRTAQYRATVSVNRELLVLYHSIGEVINAHKTWGSKFVENLAADIKLSFPDATGYSARNLKYMAKFAAAYPDDEFVQRPVAQIPCARVAGDTPRRSPAGGAGRTLRQHRHGGLPADVRKHARRFRCTHRTPPAPGGGAAFAPPA